MLKAFTEYLVGLKKNEMVTDKDGNEYILQGDEYTKLENKDPVIGDRLNSTTLQGIVDYVINRVDNKLAGEKLLVHILSPDKVELYSDIMGETTCKENDRTLLISSNAIVPDRYLRRYLDTENFVIELMSKYKENDDLNNIMRLASNIVKDQSVQTADDGVSQKIQAKTGVATVSNVEVKNPFTLIPFRTFPEIQQPKSYFIFRINKDGECALFDSGDSIWRNEAMNSIKAFLEDKLKGHNVNIIM